jgi:hypothetical protein
MVTPNNMSKLLSFPAPTPIPGSPPQNWKFRLLVARDNVINALKLLRNAYNEMLAGTPVDSAEEIVAQVKAILTINERLPRYTVLTEIETHAPITPDTKRKVLLLFPTAKAPRKNSIGIKQSSWIRSIPGAAHGMNALQHRLLNRWFHLFVALLAPSTER